jgi:hypothetical protein
MKKEKQLDQQILNITMMIQTNFPELSKYIPEMPIKISYASGTEINIKNLEDYYNSLKEFVNKYAEEHNQKDVI